MSERCPCCDYEVRIVIAADEPIGTAPMDVEVLAQAIAGGEDPDEYQEWWTTWTTARQFAESVAADYTRLLEAKGTDRWSQATTMGNASDEPGRPESIRHSEAACGPCPGECGCTMYSPDADPADCGCDSYCTMDVSDWPAFPVERSAGATPINVEVLTRHYVTAIECDHEAKTDTVRCSCSVWTGTPQPSVGAAVREWAEHAALGHGEGGAGAAPVSKETRLAPDLSDDPEGEHCYDCGAAVSVVWTAPDDMWSTVAGRPDGGGLLCVRCFDKRAEQQGMFLRWIPHHAAHERSVGTAPIDVAIRRICNVLDNDEGAAELYEAALDLYRARLSEGTDR